MRRLAVVLAAAVVVCAAAPPAAGARTDDFNKTVLAIPGPEQSDPSCSPFNEMGSHFAEYTTSVKGTKIGFAGSFVEVGLYAGSSGCSQTLGAQRGESLSQLTQRLITFINDKYKGEVVDIVAHGGAGLIVRAALEQDPKLKVEDVVTLGTPHNGSDALAAACGSRPVCAELKSRSSLARHPDGAGGTDWTVIASEADTLVGADSAVAMDADHRTIYQGEGAPSHDGLLTDTDDSQNAHIQYSHAAAPWKTWEAAPHSVNRVAEDLIFGSQPAGGACGLQATKPEVCGKTPVILVPGFGGSQLECKTIQGPQNEWPAALEDKKKYPELSLADDGSKPLIDTPCSKTVGADGHVVSTIHGDSWAWLQRIAPGRAYEFGWDYRKGPDQALAKLDKFIDDVRKKHGATRVALVTHGEGGLLARLYVDDDARAKKVARVADFGTPWWGAPRVWFTAAYGYQPPAFTPLDTEVDRDTFRAFTKNLPGLYYSVPPQAWFDNAPTLLRNWLEVDDKPVTSPEGVLNQLRAFGANATLARKVNTNQTEKLVGYSRANGVDWRTFAGSGLGTLGHVRAYSGSTTVQYSWINGDGTVPLFSQRQSATAGTPQLGDRTPVYNFCGVPHMDELEDHALQNAVAPFVADGTDPNVDGTALKQLPCQLSATEFTLTGDEDEKSIELSRAATAGAAKAHAAQAPATLTLAQAEAAGLVEVMRDAGRTVFLTHTPLDLHVADGTGTLQTAPITGEGKRGAPFVYDLASGPLDVQARGARVAAFSNGRAVAGKPGDRKAPRTTLKRRGAKLVATAKDDSDVAVTMVQVGKKAKPYKKPLRARRGSTVRYWSVDSAGNRERKHTMRVR